MSSLFRIGQTLKGRAGSYTILKQVQDTVWFARNPLVQETVVIKSVKGHPRVENERDVLRRLQDRTPFLRPLVDEIEGPSIPTTIALKYLGSDLLVETVKKTLNRKELKHVCYNVLNALQVLHDENLVHTDVKLDNILVNLQDNNDDRFADIQLGDLGGCLPADSRWATAGAQVGTAMWSAPELLMEIPWNTAADIWSFGAVLISLIYGGSFNLFHPEVPPDHEEYFLRVVIKIYRFFGPFPASITEVAGEQTLRGILWLIEQIPPEKMTPFSCITEREVCKKDREFILRIMKLDYRDRPTAREILADEWWEDDEGDAA
ncbi:hypothetical protein ACN47E_006546 [Coniothyrium glycines]